MKISQNRYLFLIDDNYYSFESNNTEDFTMSIALNYQLSIFGKYTITPSPETITNLMNKINQETKVILLPNVINSQRIEIPSNRITNIANLGFLSQDQQYNITILNERIDVNYNKVNDNIIDMKTFYEFAIKALTAVMDYSGAVSNRLAINIQQVCEIENFDKLKARGKLLLKSAEYYNDKDLIEWSMRTNTNVDTAINDEQETLNVITNISSGQDITGQKAAVLFHIDINTLQQNQNMRFEKSALEPFVQNATDIASNLIVDVERLIIDDK